MRYIKKKRFIKLGSLKEERKLEDVLIFRTVIWKEVWLNGFYRARQIPILRSRTTGILSCSIGIINANELPASRNSAKYKALASLPLLRTQCNIQLFEKVAC